MPTPADISLHPKRKQACERIAELAFEGSLDEVEYIPGREIRGTIPTTRCCVYKEREIYRQRLRVAMNKPAGNMDDNNIIQIIEPACADCPISSYVVTNNCQNCMGKACLNTCKFGAIRSERNQSVIDSNKCKECGMCAKACPYNAIAHLERPCKKACPVNAITYNDDGLAVIDDHKCIRCGVCVSRCPFGAIAVRDNIVEVIEALKSDKDVYAMIAPATEGQFGPSIGPASIRNALIELGFKDMYEVGAGADVTTRTEAAEWLEAYECGEMKTTSCCPAFVNMIIKHFPELEHCISTAASPMCNTSRMIKTKHPDAVTVFIGPCVSKKSEISDQRLEGNADYAIAYYELRAMMNAKNIEFVETDELLQTCSSYAKNYANAGGVASACEQYLCEEGIEASLNILRANGGEECRKALRSAKMGKLTAQFIEGMACEGGCLGGPGIHENHQMSTKARKERLGIDDDRTIHQSLEMIGEIEYSSHR